jgi:para-aminobenzoate synthetase component I
VTASKAGVQIVQLASLPDPLDALERVRDLPYPLLLDSATDRARLGRYSFLMADPAVIIRSRRNRTSVVTFHDGQTRDSEDDPLLTARALLAPLATSRVPDLPPFQGGVAGYIGYGYGERLERVPQSRYDDLDIPDVVLGLYDWVLAWDHQARRAWVVSTGLPEVDPQVRGRRAHDRLSLVCDRLDGPPASTSGESATVRSPAWTASEVPAPEHRSTSHAPAHPVPGHPALRSSFSREDYLSSVARVRDYIHAGDIFQANLSQRFDARYDGDPWALYRRLRVLNPAPFAAYFEAPGLAIMSASPERFIRIDETGEIETRPIKGTIPRGIGPEHDAHLGRALIESEKDRAENLMIVDLLRNDLSRVSRAGTVRVPELFALEHYSTVHHLVSTVVGQLSPGLDAIDVWRAAFPGGSITGAPKVRAMEIIAELEPTRRGVYCGVIGYLGCTGVADSSIVIRTYLAHQGRVYFSAGGGIVADSEPQAEYAETLDKARALIAALE